MSQSERTPEQLEVERDWLRRRVRGVGSFQSGTPEVGGQAANAMVEFALGGEWPYLLQFPKRGRDLRACLNTLAGAPEHLKPAMEAVVTRYQETTLLQPDPEPEHGIPLGDFVAMLEQGDYVVEEADLPRLPPGGYSAEPLQAEWQWLRERAKLCGGLLARDERLPRSWGRSGNALVDYLLGGPEPQSAQFPVDSSDLAAAEQAVKDAPEHLQAKARSVLRSYREDLGRRREPKRPDLSEKPEPLDLPPAADAAPEPGPEL